ncbi:MAG: hypothetical protein V3R94_02690 [Acidobacteriota bacterium]
MRKNRGFSSLEMMVALMLSTLVFAGFFLFLGQFQKGSSDLGLLLERDSNLWLAPLLLSRWIAPTGNNRWDQPWPGVTVQPDLLELNSDSHGRDGFPDSQLDSSFEALQLRDSKSNLQIKSGHGSFQPVIKNVADLRFDSKRMPVITIRLEAATDRPPASFEGNLSHPVEFLVLLRNYRPNLFEETR